MLSDVLVVALAVGAGAVALVLGLVLAVALGRRGAEPDGDPMPPVMEPDPDAILSQADELAAHAEHATLQAETATAAVEPVRERYAEAEQRRAAIEAEYDAAQARYAEALRDLRAGRKDPPSPEQRDRAHEVSSAALAAYRRGELSVDDLRVVFARAGDWDPEQEAREREAERLAADVGSLRRAYDIAVADVRLAAERLHVAEVAAEATTQEAVDAAVEAQVAADAAGRYRRGGAKGRGRG
jgi:chromosome segregation ATPase